MSATTKTAAVEGVTAVRDAKGRVQRGALNPGGLTKEAREKRDLMRQLLCDDAEQVHAALMRGIAADNPLLVKYAHEQLYGKAPDKLEADVRTSNPFGELNVEELRALVRRG